MLAAARLKFTFSMCFTAAQAQVQEGDAPMQIQGAAPPMFGQMGKCCASRGGESGAALGDLDQEVSEGSGGTVGRRGC